MKITCPDCSAEYNVPDTLAMGRIVRCAKCATEWAPVAAPAPEPEPPPPAAPEPEWVAPPPPAAAEIPARLVPPTPTPAPSVGRLPLLLAWAGSVAVIVAALAAALLLREPIMRAWPPSQRVYTALHLRAAGSPDVHGDVVKEPGR